MWSLFEGTPEHALVEIAPWLIALDGASPRTVSMLLHMGGRHPCLTWLRSAQPDSDLVAHLRRWHTADLQDGGTLLLRWYDTRVQEALLPTLSAAQRIEFFEGIQQWAFCDRFAQWQPVAMPQPAKGLAVSGNPLELTDAQFSALLQASQPDVVLRHLAHVLPDEISRCDARALFTLVRDLVQQATSLGWHGLDNQVQFLMPSLYTSGIAAQHPEFLRAVCAPAGEASGGMGLAERVQVLGDTVWSCGRPLWETSPVQQASSVASDPQGFPDVV